MELEQDLELDFVEMDEYHELLVMELVDLDADFD